MVTGSLGTKEGGWECSECVCSSNWYCHCLSPSLKHAHSFTASNFQKTSPPQSHSPQLIMGPAMFMQPCRVNRWATTSYYNSFSADWQVLWDCTGGINIILPRDISSIGVLIIRHSVSCIAPKSRRCSPGERVDHSIIHHLHTHETLQPSCHVIVAMSYCML